MGSVPRVSVIIAAHNVEKYIEQAVASALVQSVKELEVIVVDDASTDGTVSVVQRIDDNRVKLFQNHSNAGPSFSRNSGIMHAQGEWIAILDADDWWAPNRLEVLLGIAQKEDAQIVCDDLYLIEDGAERPWTTYFKSRQKVIGLINMVTVITPVKMVDHDYGILQPIIRRDFLNQFQLRYPEHLFFAEDYVFVLDCLVRGAKMVVYPHAYYYYRSRIGSLTTTVVANTQAHYNLMLDLVTGERYKEFPDVIQSLRSRLRGLFLALQDIRARDMFRRKRLFTAASVVLSNPSLLILYARQVKRGIVG